MDRAKMSVVMMQIQARMDWRSGWSWALYATPSQSRARVPIRRLQATEGGGAGTRKGHADQTMDGDATVFVGESYRRLFVSPAQECSRAGHEMKNGEIDSGSLSNKQEGRKKKNTDKEHDSRWDRKEKMGRKRMYEVLGKKKKLK